jgi:hypothetical protein
MFSKTTHDADCADVLLTANLIGALRLFHASASRDVPFRIGLCDGVNET